MREKLVIFFILGSLSAFSQINLEKTFSSSTNNSSYSKISFTSIGDRLVENKLGWGSDTLQINIFNSDYTINKSIFLDQNIVGLQGVQFKEIKYISDNLFNSDSKIEFLCELFYKDSENAYWEGVVIINEDGELLLEVEGAFLEILKQYNSNKVECVIEIDNACKLILPVKNKGIYETKIYSLPGHLPISHDLNNGSVIYSPIASNN